MAKNRDKYVAPEGGWGYMICIGMVIIFATCNAPSTTFGVIFHDFFEETNEKASIITLILGLGGTLISLSGIIVDLNLRWFTPRQLCFFGAFCHSMCWILNIFVPRATYMLFTNGILYGIGFGIMNVCSYAIFNEYWVEKRVMMMSICMSFIGAILMVFPFIIEFCLNNFGYRWTLALVAAFSANAFVGVALYHPIKWHSDKTIENVNIDQELIPMTNIKDTVVENKKIKSTWEKIVKNTNSRLLKKLSFWNVTLGMSVGIVGDIQFYALVPLLLYEYQLSTSQITFILSSISAADLCSRICLGIISRFRKIKSSNLYYIGLILMVIARVAFLQFQSFIGVLIPLAILGFLRGWMYVLYPFLCVEALPDENYVTVFGLASAVKTFFNLLLPPILGFARDYSGSYVYTFWILAIFNFVSIIPWCIEKYRTRFSNLFLDGGT